MGSTSRDGAPVWFTWYGVWDRCWLDIYVTTDGKVTSSIYDTRDGWHIQPEIL